MLSVIAKMTYITAEGVIYLSIEWVLAMYHLDRKDLFCQVDVHFLSGM